MLTDHDKSAFNELLRDLPVPTSQAGGSTYVKAVWQAPFEGGIELSMKRDRPDAPPVWFSGWTQEGSRSHLTAPEAAARDVRARLVAAGFELPRYIVRTLWPSEVRDMLNLVEPGTLYRLVSTSPWADRVTFVWERTYDLYYTSLGSADAGVPRKGGLV